MAHCFEDPNPKKKKDYPTLLKAKRTTPTLVLEKETKAPNQFTEATLLRPWKPQGGGR
jgi:hypothetical protein